MWVVLYIHFNDLLIKSCDHYFGGIIQSVPFRDLPFTLSFTQSNLCRIGSGAAGPEYSVCELVHLINKKKKGGFFPGGWWC